ncbi:CCR4-NOT transcription complex subunit 3 [Entamoeba marina]
MTETTLEIIPDIEFSYTKMVDKQTNKNTDTKIYPQWFPKKATQFNYESEMIDNEFLVFLFYYTQGSTAQTMASQKLREQKWRYHKGYKKWFRRINEPLYVSEISESGEFLCFEYEHWNVVTKSHFTIYYNFLEN